MLSLSVKFTDKVTTKLKRVQKALDKLPQEALNEFVKNTPIRTGNARSKTRLRDKDTIGAMYPYAQKLDDGYSQQSPQGMTKPTEEFVKKRFDQIMKGLK